MRGSLSEKIYIQKVWMKLECFLKSRKSCIASCKAMIDDTKEDNVLTNYKSYVSVYGKPKTVAENYMSEVSETEISKYKCVRRILRCTAVIIVIFAIALSVFFSMRNQKRPVYRSSVPVVLEEPFRTDEFGNPIQDNS